MKVICKFNWAGTNNYLTNNKIYDAILTPTQYDPMSYRPATPSYIISCDDGCARVFPAQLFIPIEEMRNEKIDQITNEEV